MYLHACQARGLGKLCSHRTTGVKVWGYVIFFRESVLRWTIFDEKSLGHPCRELSLCNQRLRCQHDAFVVLARSYTPVMHSTWLVETQNYILSRIAILYYTSSVQVERQMGMRIFSTFFHKNGDISGSLGRIWMRFVSHGDVIYIFLYAKREVWENSVARERPRLQFGVMSRFLKKVHFARRFSMKNRSGVPAGSLAFSLRKKHARELSSRQGIHT